MEPITAWYRSGCGGIGMYTVALVHEITWSTKVIDEHSTSTLHLLVLTIGYLGCPLYYIKSCEPHHRGKYSTTLHILISETSTLSSSD